MKKIKNSFQFKVKSTPTYIINILSREGVTLNNIEREHNYVMFYVGSKDYTKTLNILKGYNREFKEIKKSGAVNYFNDFIMRFGLWITIIILSFASISYSFVSLNVKIYGLENVNESEIYQILDQNSVKFPIVKSNIDIEKLKLDILNLDGISNCDIRLVGNVIEVNILEELPRPEIIDITKPKPLISSHDAIVTRIITLNGTALCKKNEAVRKGETLIAPYYILDAENELHYPIRANGYVYGRVWYTKSYIFSNTMIKRERTGREERKVDFSFPWLDIESKSSYALYESEKIVTKLDAIIPITITQIVFYEINEEEVQFNFSENEAALVEKAYREMDGLIPEDALFLRKWYSVKTLDKNTVLDIYYEVEQIISIYQ